MGSNRSILLQKEEIQEISAETGFSPKQITRLYSRFTSLDKKNLSYLTKEDFVRIPELHINPLRDRIIDVIVDDNGSNDRINFKQFAKVFSTFRRGKTDDVSKDNKLRFLFSVYDRDKDNMINKTELQDILKMLVGGNLPEEQMNAIAERTIAELGDHGNITFAQFCDTLEKIDIDEKMSMKFLT